jgi:L-threonine kinase
MLAVCQESGGLGVVTAHSGTLVGVLLADDDPAHSEKLDRAVRGCRRLAGHAVVYRSLYEANERSLASSTMSQGGV